MSTGRVSIVGAGPGAPDLISLRGYRALLGADAVLADRLLPPTFLEQLGISAADREVKWLGEDRPRWSQRQINEWLVAHARKGQSVVRLKGGDPLIFGRGDEEMAFLAVQGIPCELIPGSSSCTAVLSAAGLSLTHHAQRESFAVATARLVGGTLQTSFPRADTLVVLMGAAVLEQVAARLQAAGWPADTPAAIVERGTLPWERRVRGPLGQLAALAEHAAVSSPALMVVGAAAAVDPGVPTRARILFTGLDPENFRALGDLLHWPALACVSDQEGQRLLPGILLRLQERAFPWIAFDSARAVTSFLAALARYNLDLRALAGLAVVALGRSASLRLRELGLRADVCGNTVDLLHNLQPAAPQPGLLVHGTHASRDFAAQLEEAGVRAVELSLLSVVPNPELGRPLPSHDVIYFVSPSGVHSYWSVYGAPAFREQAWCLGEQTQRALRQYGVTARIVAPQTVSFCGVARLGEFAGLATASSRRFSRRGRRG